MTKFYHKLPDLIKSVLLVSEGWLVGSAIGNLIEDKIPKDYDIIVPDRERFQTVCKQLSSLGTINFNSYGGIKYEDDKLIIDIWCEELDHFLKNAGLVTYVFNYKKCIVLKKEI
jgi:hypothetical protein